MSKIVLSSAYAPISEGMHTFTIENVDYNEAFGSIKILLVAENGKKHTERYGLLTKDGEVNNGAMSAFSFFARSVTGNLKLDEIEPEELVGCRFKANVVHNTVPSTKDPTKTYTNVKFDDIVALGAETTDSASSVSLRDLLG